MPAASSASRAGKAGRPRILVEIAQDIGELERAAKMVREQPPGVALDPEHPH